VRRLEHAMRMEEAAMRASYARAVSLLNAGLCNLTIDQRKELGGILGSFARVQQQALRAIGESWKTMYGVDHELGLVDDDKLIESYGKVVNLLADGNHAMIETIDRADEALVDRAHDEVQEHIARSTDRHQYAAEPARRSRTVRPGTSAHRPTAGPVVTFPVDHPPDRARPYDQAFAAARVGLDGAWKRGDLERALSVSKTQALTYIQAWLVSGDIIRLDEPRDHYVFTEER
jgi:hypothetical protein